MAARSSTEEVCTRSQSVERHGFDCINTLTPSLSLPHPLRTVLIASTRSLHLPRSLTPSSLPTGAGCPANTAGIDIPSGCTVNPGASGTVTATTTAPYYAIEGVNGGAVTALAGYSLVNGLVTGTVDEV